LSDAARGVRILHAALAIGLSVVAATFVLVLRSLGPLLTTTPLIGYATVGLGLANLAVVVGFFRPRIPQRPVDQLPDEYWATTEARAAVIVIWAMIEGAGLISLVGYLLTGSVVPAAVAALAIVTLIVLRPALLEGDGVV